jgi:hypothetical protein
MGSFISALLGGGGPSAQMKTTAAQQTSLANSLFADYNQRFQGQSDILSQLRSSYAPLIAAGPGQQGFTSPVLAALNTQAINNSAAASRNARQAAGNFSAGQNNTSGLTSGITKQINASVDSQAANNLASTQDQITQANYKQGRENYFAALNGDQSVAQMENPTAFSSQAGQNLSESFSQGSKINDENNAKSAALWGGLASLGIDAATFGMGGVANLDTTGGSSVGEQFGNVFKGGIDALSGGNS